MRVIIINGPKVQCGIYQYSQSLYDVLTSMKTKYTYEFFPTDSVEDARSIITSGNVHAVIYNHHPMALAWLDSGFTRPIRNQFGIKQIMITGHEHETRYIGVDDYIYTDPNFPSMGNVHAGIPPLLFYDDIKYHKSNGTIKIGTSGIGNSTKNLHELVNKINQDFTDEEVILNVHITDGAYVDPTGKFSDMLATICEKVAHSNVKIHITRSFMSKKDLVKWLNQNDINIYWHTIGPNLGVSSSIDRAIEARKPFGVNQSNFFKHVIRDHNDITQVSIKSIIENGVEPFQEFYDKWSPEKLITLYERIIDGTQ